MAMTGSASLAFTNQIVALHRLLVDHTVDVQMIAKAMQSCVSGPCGRLCGDCPVNELATAALKADPGPAALAPPVQPRPTERPDLRIIRGPRARRHFG